MSVQLVVQVLTVALRLPLLVLTAMMAMSAFGSNPSQAQAQRPAGAADIADIGDTALDTLPAELSIETPSPFGVGAKIVSHPLRGVRPEVVNQILTAQARGEVAIEAVAVPLPSTGGEQPLAAFFVEIDGPSFLGHNQAEVARLEIYAYALAPDGRVAGYLAEAFAVDVSAQGETIWQSGLKFYGALALTPGEYTLRVLVRDYRSAAFGLRRVEVVVPQPVGEGLQGALPPPVFAGPSTRDSWLAVRGRSESAVRAFSPYPLAVEGRSISPAARPVLAPGRPAEGFLFGTDLGEADIAAARVELLEEGEAGRLIGTSDLELVQASEPGQGAYTLRFTAPEAPPGFYRLRMTIAGKAGPAGVSTAVPVVLAGGGTQDRELLWSDLRSLISGPVVSTPMPREAPTAGSGVVTTDLSKKGRRGKAVRRLARLYRAALAELDEESFESARAALFELESEVLAGRDSDSFKHLRAAELSVAKELLEQGHELALPVLVLHAELGRLYRDRRLFSLVGHARAMVETVADWHVDHGGSFDLTATALVLEAGHLQRANLPAGSRRLFARALEHDPDNAAALLGIATSLEKYGGYSQAIAYLQQLVTARPDFDQAVLRLAINDIRVGRLERAQALLVRIVERDRKDWVSALACQELARIRLTAGDTRGGQEILETATERMPDRPGLGLLLAHIYDRTGHSDRSLSEILQVVASSGRGGGSARYRYDEWPQDFLSEARESLAAGALRASSRFSRVLAEEGSENGTGGR